jgi:hypothetical protein
MGGRDTETNAQRQPAPITSCAVRRSGRLQAGWRPSLKRRGADPRPGTSQAGSRSGNSPPIPGRTCRNSRIDCGRVGVHAWTTVQALARDLPGTAPRVPSRRPLAQSSAPPFTWAVVWSSEALTGGVNPRRIDGKDGIAAPTESMRQAGFTRADLTRWSAQWQRAISPSWTVGELLELVVSMEAASGCRCRQARAGPTCPPQRVRRNGCSPRLPGAG